MMGPENGNKEEYYPKAGDIISFGGDIGVVMGWIGLHDIIIESISGSGENKKVAWNIDTESPLANSDVKILMRAERLKEIGANPVSQIEITPERPR